MTRLNLAYTAPINPSGATPVLTVEQVWKGLERKVRFAQEFVPVIESCDVVKEEDVEVDRYVKFKAGSGQGKEGEAVHEIVRMYEPTKVREILDGTLPIFLIRLTLQRSTSSGTTALWSAILFLMALLARSRIFR